MKFSAFRKGALALATENNSAVEISRDSDIGKYFARYSDGTMITGTPSGYGLTVRWNANQHQARAVLKNGRICAR